MGDHSTESGVDQRFRKSNKLLASSEFDAVFKGKQYRLGSGKFLILAKNNNVDQSRIGMVIGKKITKLAVNRTKIKRRIRETFRTSLLKKYSLDIVVVARSGVNTCTNNELNASLKELWSQLAIKATTSSHHV